ncbi:uncharacterized protein LOC129245794 isoform X2 [Anastrepha obliqua]|uniref:uncharacterized protein LOC129245794 isoform X2 n=1 Tax=Anastrepha obliqua TaxID=95512 RepID=UPI00240A8C11|nr:uncharacterized protein LOC129245794 isoform X2 [Anastrepha obliqua]
MCEPNFYLPQTVSAIFKSEADAVEIDNKTDRVNEQQSAEHQTNYYRVLPLLSYKNDHHKEVLSLKENEYLRLRWQKFLSDKPTEYIRIRLYRDQMKTDITPRPMQLNGRFYGVDNKLSPAPIIPDPRMI